MSLSTAVWFIVLIFILCFGHICSLANLINEIQLHRNKILALFTDLHTWSISVLFGVSGCYELSTGVTKGFAMVIL